jgi:hypothetical protein
VHFLRHRFVVGQHHYTKLDKIIQVGNQGSKQSSRPNEKKKGRLKVPGFAALKRTGPRRKRPVCSLLSHPYEPNRRQTVSGEAGADF